MTQVSNGNNLIDSNFNACDIGPGNYLIDQWVKKNSKKKFDKNGELAKSGKVDNLIFNLAVDNFSKESYEKSLDVKDFDISFVKGLSLEDGCATLTKFSAYLITQGIENFNNHNNFFSINNFVCGGGRKK